MMIKHMLAGAATLALAACSSPEDVGEETGVETPDAAANADATPPAPPETPDKPIAGRVTYENNSKGDAGGERGSREFSYSWPGEVAEIPALAAELEKQRDKQLAEQKEWWAEALADCPADSASCRNLSFELSWDVVADLPRFLSLSSGFYMYTGGAHGNSGRGSIVWDREAEASIEPKEMFASLDSLDAAIGDTACTMLNKERAKRRGEPVTQSDGEWPDQCVTMDETVLFIGSSNGAKFDRLGVYYAPYIAGAYAEGDFEFTLPVTQAVISALKPEYREAFSAK
ncbi:DUF4163 domain-containing protein [Erythrobacter sp. F6033]|uniref:PdaC/SigV domain-containing protein n=1 Tax=Erythrobacter sp. F6033 TaxID=2926401 RepID=UPI001FF6601D|nr:DUF4163 domain-containing protein [Erythrobacter sp. F6033]MCK0129040.1 DUF3298 and DUF4163 domain-containing protein [Erythrobacter sp. F6033]